MLFASHPDVMVVDVPVVFISAHEQYREHAETLGCAFLGKRIQKSQMLAAVASAVESKRKGAS